MSRIDPYTTAVLAYTLTLLIAACAVKPVSRMVEYECNRGTMLSATFSADGKYVNISTEHVENLQLPAVPSDSGFIYSTGRHEFRGKGKEAMWSTGRMVPEDCIAR